MATGAPGFGGVLENWVGFKAGPNYSLVDRTWVLSTQACMCVSSPLSCEFSISMLHDARTICRKKKNW